MQKIYSYNKGKHFREREILQPRFLKGPTINQKRKSMLFSELFKSTRRCKIKLHQPHGFGCSQNAVSANNGLHTNLKCYDQ